MPSPEASEGPRAGKHAIGAKRGKTCNAKHGKTCTRCQARENVKPVPSAGKHETGAKRGKKKNNNNKNRWQARERLAIDSPLLWKLKINQNHRSAVDEKFIFVAILPLCLKTLILAPDNLAPKMSDVWLSSSLMIKSPLPTRVGILEELVANPIPKTIAAGLPTNLATTASSSL